MRYTLAQCKNTNDCWRQFQGLDIVSKNFIWNIPRDLLNLNKINEYFVKAGRNTNAVDNRQSFEYYDSNTKQNFDHLFKFRE